MKTITVDQFKRGLEAAARQKGEAGVIAAKSLMLEGAMLVDEAGAPIDPESVDVVIRPAAAAVVEDGMDAPKAEGEKSLSADLIAKTVRDAIRAERLEMQPERKAFSVGAPKRFKMTKTLKHFKSAEKAFAFGQFLLATKSVGRAIDYCRANGIQLKAHTEGVNEQGGVLVPEEFSEEIITLRESFGVFRREANVTPMLRDTKSFRKRRGGLTAYWVGEARAGTESTGAWDQVSLVAKKLMVLTTYSNELGDDAIINFADDAVKEIAYAFAQSEDLAGWIGNGTSTYGGIVGVGNAIGAAAISDSAIGTGDLTTITQATVSKMFSLLPQYALTANTKIFCHKSVYHQIFERLQMGAGGVTAQEVANGAQPKFFGYPVVFSQALPAATTTADGTVLAYFGDLTMAAYLGDRNEMAVAMSDSALNAFEQDEVAIRGIQRVDIQCFNVGSATEAGPLIQFTR